MISYTQLMKQARLLGFELLGVVEPDISSEVIRFYENWISQSKYAGMNYLVKHARLKADSAHVFQGAQSVMVLGLNYFHPQLINQKKASHGKPQFAAYAKMRDYHKIFWRQGRMLIRQLWGYQAQARVVADSAPVFERYFAAKTGQGFIGKNTMYIVPGKGSYFLLGEIYSSEKILMSGQGDGTQTSLGSGCGSCRRCQVHCPTDALQEDYQVDARRCLSYWTIEHRGLIPTEFWPFIKDFIFGCDICQIVCPYNRKAVAHNYREDLLVPRDYYQQLSLEDMIFISEEAFLRYFGGSPVMRCKRTGLRRNALIAKVVQDKTAVQPLVDRLKNDDDQVIVATAKQAEQWLRQNTNT